MNRVHVVLAQTMNQACHLADDLAWVLDAKRGGRSGGYFVHVHGDKIEFRPLGASLGLRYDRYWITEAYARQIWSEEDGRWLRREAAKSDWPLGQYLSREWMRYLITGE